MHQIPADKFGMIQSDDPVRVTRLPAAGRKGHFLSEFLIPGMKNLNNPGCCAEPLFTGRKFKKCLGAASVQKGIEKPLVAVKQGIQFMRKRKDHMKVRGVDDFSPALVHPDFFVDGLTVRAVTVTAGIIVELQMATVLTLRNVDAKVTGFAAEDSTRSFPLDIGLVDA